MSNQTERSEQQTGGGCRRTEPTRSLLQGGAYTRSEATDLKKLFERIKLDNEDCATWADGKGHQ